ncbi:MAG TPA: ATP-dependent Clp protease ATP-binding subunit, partial [Saprospiraceae bacterium]|nr:ATP-dependent Clp protease ATP-binding subunit [Saprospiraceae bacterium]
IPVIVRYLVTKGAANYQIRPLFVPYPISTHRRFEQAMSDFQRKIKRMFRNFELNRTNLNSLLWYKFNPKLNYKVLQLKIHLGKQFIKGNFAYASFDLGNHKYICLPFFESEMLMLPQHIRKKEEVIDFVKDTITKILHQKRKYSKSNIDFDIYTSHKKEFITNVDIQLNIKRDIFAFEERITKHHSFANLYSQNDFDGATELEKVGYEIGEHFPKGLKRAYHRDDLVEKIKQIIFQKENTPIVLIGSAGVGKKTLIEEAIFKYRQKRKELQTKENKNPLKRTWFMDPTRVISGMSIVGMWQKRVESIIQYLINPNPLHLVEKKIKTSYNLVIHNVIGLLRIGKSAQNDMTMGDVFKPYLEQRKLQLILTATPNEWKIIQEKNRRFSDLFQLIRIDEPPLEKVAKIILSKRIDIENEQACEFTISALQQLFVIQRNYLKRKALPGSIINLMEQLAIKYRYSTIDSPEIRQEFELTSGLNEKIFDNTQSLEKEEVKNFINARLIGQKDASDALTNVVHTIKAKLTDKNKPLGSFLFIGPTGVGKTQAAKVLSQYLMGDEKQLMRFDMNEYIDGGALHRLIGDYYNPEGQLTGKVRYQPFGVILLDEIEKAHPSVRDLLLQVLDDGRLTDSLGRTVDFSNTIIVMTSNLGAREVSSTLGFETQSKEDNAIYLKAVENRFRPEFINRIDQIVIFNSLQLEHILNIARLQIKELLQRDGFVRRTTILNISQEALKWVAQRGFDAKMGGRALKRQIEKDLTALSAEQLIATYNNSPIIFEILLENKKLVPNVIPLEFTQLLQEDWLPQLPHEKHGRKFYSNLIRSIEKLERQVAKRQEKQNGDVSIIVDSHQKASQLNWQYYAFKDRIAEIKEQIQTISISFRNQYFKPATSFRLKGSGYSLIISNNYREKATKTNIEDRLFQQGVLEELTEAYKYGSSKFDSLQSEFLNHYVNTALLQIMAKDFLKGKTENYELRFKSVINGMGKKEIEYLSRLYQSILKELDISYKVKGKYDPIQLEGHAISRIFDGEKGIHLFYKTHKNPLPILVLFNPINSKKTKLNYKVIRIYDNQTLTDLRTGFSNATNISPAEFKILLFAGVTQKTKPVILE